MMHRAVLAAPAGCAGAARQPRRASLWRAAPPAARRRPRTRRCWRTPTAASPAAAWREAHAARCALGCCARTSHVRSAGSSTSARAVRQTVPTRGSCAGDSSAAAPRAKARPAGSGGGAGCCGGRARGTPRLASVSTSSTADRSTAPRHVRSSVAAALMPRSAASTAAASSSLCAGQKGKGVCVSATEQREGFAPSECPL